MSKIISGFSSNNYILLGNTMNITSSSDTWEVVIRASMNGADTQHLLTFGTADNKGFLARFESRKIALYVASGNTNSWDLVSGNKSVTTFTDNTWYFFKWSFNGTQYLVDSSTDGINWTNEITVNESRVMYTTNQQLYLGYRNMSSSTRSEYWRGKINLSETYIKVNNQYIFNGTTATQNGYLNTGCVIIDEPCWTNFSDNDYFTIKQLPSSISNAEIIFKAIFIASNNYHSTLLGSTNSNPFSTIVNRYGNLPSFYLNGWINGTTQLSNNATYWYKLVYDGTNYTLYTIQDNNYSLQSLPTLTNWVQQCTTTNNFNLQDRQFFIGKSLDATEYWKGFIEQCQIIIDGQEWFNLKTAIEGTDYTKTGSVLYISNANIASNFSYNNYLKVGPFEFINNDINVIGIIRAYIVSNNNPQDILARSSGLDRCWCLQASNVSNANKIDYYNGSSHLGNTVFKNNTWYWLGYSWNGYTYKFYSMEDTGKYNSYKELPQFSNSDWTLEMQYDDTNNLYETGFNLGCNVMANNSNRYWRGQIDLNNTIIGNNVIYWSVSKEGFITKYGMQTISQDTTENVTLEPGI